MKKRTKKVYRYTAVFEPEKEGGYSVSIPILPGCFSQGETFEEATKNIREAAELYLSVVKPRHQLFGNNKDIIVAPVAVHAF
jgi:predicted RNase H-like HicB family nuclease